MKLIYLKSALKCDSFDVAIDSKIQFFRVLVTIETGRSLVRYQELFESSHISQVYFLRFFFYLIHINAEMARQNREKYVI